MEVAATSESDEESDNSDCILPEDLEDEVDINIHFHCEHCIKLSKCKEWAKPGWSCDIIECVNGCGHKFHECKSDEHEMLCGHAQIPCINSGNGCPHILQRQSISSHLPECPASVVVCNAEWNRWAIGSRERERISSARGVTENYTSNDLDMSFALDDQRMVNEMHLQPKYLRKIMCNGITKRFPSLPLTIRGSIREECVEDSKKSRLSSHSTTDDEEEGLTPGLSLSVCTELLRGKKNMNGPQSAPKPNMCNYMDSLLLSSLSLHSDWPDERATKSKISSQKSDDISAFCCSHGILKDLCQFCRDDPDEPNYKYMNVWRERIDLSNPGVISWKKEPRIEKIRKRNPFGVFVFKRIDESEEDVDYDDDGVAKTSGSAASMTIDDQGRPLGHFRFQTPPPAQLTPKGLSLELVLKHFSRHQVKPKAMFTFQCMKEMRRDEFANHHKNVHAEIQEGLEGWLMERCPMHIFGCPYSLTKMHPMSQENDVVFCHYLRAFGVKRGAIDKNEDMSCIVASQGEPRMKSNSEHSPAREAQNTPFMASSSHITFLPVEVLQNIARYLDGFSLNNLSLTCSFMRDVCFSVLGEKGLVIQEWVRQCNGLKISWKLGRNKWFFPKSFEYVPNWTFSDKENMANHLTNCPFNIRFVSDHKFCYSHLRRGDIRKSESASQE